MFARNEPNDSQNRSYSSETDSGDDEDEEGHLFEL